MRLSFAFFWQLAVNIHWITKRIYLFIKINVRLCWYKLKLQPNFKASKLHLLIFENGFLFAFFLLLFESVMQYAHSHSQHCNAIEKMIYDPSVRICWSMVVSNICGISFESWILKKIKNSLLLIMSSRKAKKDATTTNIGGWERTKQAQFADCTGTKKKAQNAQTNNNKMCCIYNLYYCRVFTTHYRLYSLHIATYFCACVISRSNHATEIWRLLKRDSCGTRVSVRCIAFIHLCIHLFSVLKQPVKRTHFSFSTYPPILSFKLNKLLLLC